MNAQELRVLAGDELNDKLKGSRRELYELRFKMAVGQLDNHREIRRVRKDIARVLTLIHERSFEGWVMPERAVHELGIPGAASPPPEPIAEPAAADLGSDLPSAEPEGQ